MDIPEPRYLANGKEISQRDGDLVAGITVYADEPDEMREMIRYHTDLGVDQIKLSMSGEEVSSGCDLDITRKNRDLDYRFDQHKIVTSPMKRLRHVWRKHTA